MKTRIIGAIIAVVLAIAGGVALFFYVQGADERAAKDAELVEAYVVSELVPQGTPSELVLDFVAVEKVQSGALPDDVVTDFADIENQVTTTDLLPGDFVREGRFADAEEAAAGGVAVPEGLQEVTITLPVDRVVGGAVSSGDFVGVVYSTNTDTRVTNSGIALTQFMFHRMLVTTVTPGTTVTSGASEEEAPIEVDAFMVTIAANTPQVEKLVFAAEQQEDGNGGIWLTLEPETADQSGSNSRTGENIFQ